MSTRTGTRLSRKLVVVALVFEFGGLLCLASAVTARVLTQPAPSVTVALPDVGSDSGTGKLSIYLRSIDGAPAVGYELFVTDLRQLHLIAEGETDMAGYWAAPLPPGRYFVSTGVMPGFCYGWSEEVIVVAGKTTATHGSAGCGYPR